MDTRPQQKWHHAVRAFLHPRVITMLFFGFSAGIPLLLIFSSLSLWLREAGVDRAAVTFFSWAALGYSFKFVWAPLVDQVPLPLLTKTFGRRRGWILLAQCSIITAITTMALIDPAGGTTSLTLMALAAVVLGFSSATQDIVIDAYRIESAEPALQALLSATYIAGYRIGMLVSGAGTLFLASAFGTAKGAYVYEAWQWAYLIIALTMTVGIVTTLVIPEPLQRQTQTEVHTSQDYARFFLMFILAALGFFLTFYHSAEVVAGLKATLSHALGATVITGLALEAARLALGVGAACFIAILFIRVGLVRQSMLMVTYIGPITDFFKRYGLKSAVLLLSLIGVYRISDIVLGVISNVFYQDLGFTKTEIATVVQTFGLVMTIAGGFLGGMLSLRYGILRMLFLGAVLSAGTNLLFMLLASIGRDLPLLYLVISVDNLSAGLASAAFVAFLSSLTNIQFTAMQYAMFSSLMTLFPKLLGGYSGTIVDSIGYPSFFIFTTILGIPVLVLIWKCKGLTLGE